MRSLVVLCVALAACSRESQKAPPPPPPAASTAAMTVASSAPSAVVAQQKAPRWLRRVKPNKVSASSTYAEHNEFHPPEHAFDGDRRTAWNEGAKGNGEGQWIEATLDKPTKLVALDLDSGYLAFSLKFGDVFPLNAHLARANVELKGGATISRDIPADVRSIRVELDGAPVTGVKVTAEKVHAGSKWEDLGISEVALWADATDGGTTVLTADVESAIKDIKDHYDTDSATRAVQLLQKLGVPLPGDLIDRRRARVDFVLDEFGPEHARAWFLQLRFRTKPEDYGSGKITRAQDDVLVALGELSGGKWVVLGSDAIRQSETDESFVDKTRFFRQPLGKSGAFAMNVLWQFPSHRNGATFWTSGSRIYSVARGGFERVLDMLFEGNKESDVPGVFTAGVGPSFPNAEFDATSFVYAGN